MTFVSPQVLANLALEPRAFNDRGLIEPWIYSGSAQPSPAIDAPASVHILELLEAAVLSLVSTIRSEDVYVDG